MLAKAVGSFIGWDERVCYNIPMERISFGNTALTLVNRPNANDIQSIQAGRSFHPLVISELRRVTLHPKIEHYPDHAFLIFHFPQFDRKTHELLSTEVDFILTNNELWLVQYGDLEPLDALKRKLVKDPELQAEFFQADASFLLYKILEHLFSSLFPQLDHIINKVDHLESEIFCGGADDLVEKISLLRREAIAFKRTVRPNTEILKEITVGNGVFFGGAALPYFGDLASLCRRLNSLIDNQIETLQVLHETNTAMLSSRLSHIMRLLTIFSVIVFPLTLMASIFSMRASGMPFIGQPYDFWIIICFMAIVALSMLGYFKRKKWM